VTAVRVDTHQHFWQYDAAEYAWIDGSMAALRRDFLPDDVRPAMARAGFDACVAVQARQSLEETRWLLSLADAHPFVVGVVGWVDLQADDVPVQLRQIAAHPKLVGVRHIVQSEPDDRFLLRPAFCRGVAALEEFDLVYDVLVYSRQLPAAIEFVSRFPRQRFVLDHLAKPGIRGGELREWASRLREIATHPTVCCKVSGLVTEADWRTWNEDLLRPYLDVAFDAFPAERLMIGSDWPVCTVAADYERTMAVVTGYLSTRTAEEREAVLGGTARRVWRLSAVEEL
jgi:L-fuconolactonase